MAMRMSGWVRVWLVAAVLWWSAGAWWLIETHAPQAGRPVPAIGSEGEPLIKPEAVTARYKAKVAMFDAVGDWKPRPAAGSDALAVAMWTSAEHDRATREAFARSAADAPFTQSDYIMVPTDDWSERTNNLYFVMFAPFAAACAAFVAGLVALWIWRGFAPRAKA